MSKRPKIGVVLPRRWEKAYFGRGGKLGDLDAYLSAEFPSFDFNTDLVADEPNESLVVLALSADGETVSAEVSDADIEAFYQAIEAFFAPSLTPSN
ncbi:hypothetical protein [Devosia sp. MC521]|uniref:hypothetical protein n=1 Tax=Devosia sp. MC521 TaxID=2759954 RepID=UPI0015FB9123|nr:hypothetical protein [Devosia sp. MC521]MBJ6986928.1 hypothetical protein [Devosia sp. MC521]QMW63952.1 hypothetical protein H4N61_06450 [Devosia sp. MC521]